MIRIILYINRTQKKTSCDAIPLPLSQVLSPSAASGPLLPGCPGAASSFQQAAASDPAAHFEFSFDVASASTSSSSEHLAFNLSAAVPLVALEPEQLQPLGDEASQVRTDEVPVAKSPF